MKYLTFYKVAHLLIGNHGAQGPVQIELLPQPTEPLLLDLGEASHHFSHLSLNNDLKLLQPVLLSREDKQHYRSLDIAWRDKTSEQNGMNK